MDIYIYAEEKKEESNDLGSRYKYTIVLEKGTKIES